MNADIIKKLNLKKTNHFNGNAFVNGLYTFIWPNAIKGWKTYLMDCDLQGNKLPDGVIFFLSNYPKSGCKNYGSITQEFILNNEPELIIKVIQT